MSRRRFSINNGNNSIAKAYFGSIGPSMLSDHTVSITQCKFNRGTSGSDYDMNYLFDNLTMVQLILEGGYQVSSSYNYSPLITWTDGTDNNYSYRLKYDDDSLYYTDYECYASSNELDKTYTVYAPIAIWVTKDSTVSYYERTYGINFQKISNCYFCINIIS